MFPLGGHRLIAKDYADGAMPVDADDDVPESAISRVRRRWQSVCGAIQRRRGVAPGSDIEGDFDTKDVRVIDEKDTEVCLWGSVAVILIL